MTAAIFLLLLTILTSPLRAEAWQAAYETTEAKGTARFDEAHLKIEYADPEKSTLLFNRKEKLLYLISVARKSYLLGDLEQLDPVVAACAGDSPRSCYSGAKFKKVGTDSVDGRLCDRYELKDAREDGKPIDVTFWYSDALPTLHFVKLEMARKGKVFRTVALRDVKKVPDDAAAFVVPKDYFPISP